MESEDANRGRMEQRKRNSQDAPEARSYILPALSAPTEIHLLPSYETPSKQHETKAQARSAFSFQLHLRAHDVSFSRELNSTRLEEKGLTGSQHMSKTGASCLYSAFC